MNYGQLKASIEATLNRTDSTPTLTASFIDKGIRLIQRRVRLPFMEKGLKIDVGPVWTGIDIPADMLAPVSIQHSGNLRRPLVVASLVQFHGVDPTSTPQVYTRQLGSYLIAGTPAEGSYFLFAYHADMAVLADDEDTNGLLASAPDAVEWAALIFAAEHFEDPRGDRWNARYEATMTALEDQGNQLELNDQTMASTVEWGRIA